METKEFISDSKIHIHRMYDIDYTLEQMTDDINRYLLSDRNIIEASTDRTIMPEIQRIYKLGKRCNLWNK